MSGRRGKLGETCQRDQEQEWEKPTEAIHPEKCMALARLTASSCLNKVVLRKVA